MSLLKTSPPEIAQDALNGDVASLATHLRRYIDSALRNGWNEDPEHTPIKHPARIGEFLECLAMIVAKGGAEPAVHPTLEGDINARWSDGDRIVNLTADLDSMTAELYYRERSSGTRAVEVLNLNDGKAWDTIETQIFTAYPNG